MDRKSRRESSSATGLLEREHQLALLAVALERAAAGNAGVVLIEGDAGLGKTSVLECTAELALTQGFAVRRARGGSLERTFGWGVARQLFEELLARASAPQRRALLRGSASLAAPVLGLADVEEQEASPVKDFRFEHGLYWLVSNLSERAPVALLIDDVQWCDDATLEWLLYLIRRAERLPLLMLAAARTGEPGGPTRLLELIAAESIAQTVVLPALGVAATEALLEHAYGSGVDHEFGLACHEWTGGNPLFVRALADELAAEGVATVGAAVPRIKTLRPGGVARVTLLRLARLSAEALDLARAAAVLESAAELRHASELAELSEHAAVAALDELVDARVLSPASPLRFVHPLIGGVVYDDVPSARRAVMHNRAARLLAAAGAEPGRIAAHLLRSAATGNAWVVDELRGAAQRELRRGSPSTAVELLRRARAEPPSADTLADLLFELGRAESLSGDTAGVQTLQAALAASTDDHRQGEVSLHLGRLLLTGGDPRAAVHVARAAADAVGWQDADLRLQLEALLINAARGDVNLVDEIPARLRSAREHAGEDTYGARLIAAQLSWGATATAAPAARAVEFARRGLDGGRLISESPSAPDAYLGAIHMLAFCDELSEADELFVLAIELAQRNGSAAAFAGASCFRSYTAYLRGRLEDAELLARDALRVCADSPALVIVDRLATAFLALTLTNRGAVEEAGRVLADEPAELEHLPVSWATEMMFAAGCWSITQGRLDEGAALLLGCGRRALAWGVVNPAWLPWRSEAALALHRLGDGDESLRLCHEELELARRFGARRSIGIALRAQGLIDPGQSGIRLLRESSDVLASSPARLERARTLVALGCALRRANCRAEARPLLAEGLSLAEQCGAIPLAEEARSELAVAGARPRSPVRTGADALTAAERRVCELAAAGKSNPEIAQLLFVTRATVESHLHRAYRTLDISSRKELLFALPSNDQGASVIEGAPTTTIATGADRKRGKDQ